MASLGFRVVDIPSRGIGDGENMVALGAQENETAVVALTLGVFDLFHRGHFHFLKEVAAQSDKMIVGMHTDSFVSIVNES